ncbi:hypothetical protein HK16_12490 [Acetobacter senegalensis]|uniref:Uncharacterized protein n=2 Tax=Acetobacter TaxID=434 RepID=A0A252EIP5_9PROT|nr:hypothetical protein CIW82_18435 [Acetobacter tropicalis]OUL66074.1 hypothetical protein HK16_12490 [Acetobacter senegalensis]
MMSISTISVQTLTGPASLLNRLVKELVEGYCHSEDIMFLDEKTVQVTLYNGSGSTLLHYADALSVEYPALDIRAVEWVDCFEDVSAAYWKSGRKIYQCDLCEIVSCEKPEGYSGPLADKRIRFWQAVPDLKMAIQHILPDYDLMALSELATLAGGWLALHNADSKVLLRLPSQPDLNDGCLVQLSSEIGCVAIVQGIDRYGCCASEQSVAYADVTARWPELRPFLRSYWRSGKKQRTRNRRWRQLQKKMAGKPMKSRLSLRHSEEQDIPF